MNVQYRLEDLGYRRVLTVDGREYPTTYSARLVQMLVERKGAARVPQYFTYKESRGRRFLDPLFAYLSRQGARDLRARGRVLLRPPHGIPCRAAARARYRHVRHGSGLRRHGARQGGGAGA